MCVCHRNWQSNDCSERVCPFGRAFVDTPKGDLDGSGGISGPDHRIAENNFVYPYGTSESFPNVRDTSFRIVDNSAHDYMECSNSGACNRRTGACECYEGFDGASCQRVSCPGSPTDICSGHGVCATNRKIAALDADSPYRLWDRGTVVGCVCDKGYTGGDCSLRACRQGLDPTYLYDDSATVRYPVYNLALMTTSATKDFYDGTFSSGPGNWAISLFDLSGKGWQTEPLLIGASCAQVVAALESLPDRVVPRMSVDCMRFDVTYRDPLLPADVASELSQLRDSRWVYVKNETFDVKNISVVLRPTFWEAGFSNSYDLPHVATDPRLTGYIYRLELIGNPGAAPPLQITTYMGDGSRPSLASRAGTLLTKVWSDGRQGESVEHFPFHCDNVKVQIASVGDYFYFTGFNTTEKKWLQQCLGQADLDPARDIDPADTTSIDWDYGSVDNPHIIKLVRAATDHADGGWFVALYFDTTVTGLDKCGFSDGTFKLLNQISSRDFPTENGILNWFEIFTTKGVLQVTTTYASAFFDFASSEIFTANLQYDVYGEEYDGDMSCEPNVESPFKAKYLKTCLSKGDVFFLLDPLNPQYNPTYFNMYTVKRVFQKEYFQDHGAYFGFWPYLQYTLAYNATARTRFPTGYEAMHYKTYTIQTDVSTNWAQDVNGAAKFRVFKFVPAPADAYTYVAECSNRGVCNTFDGICDCFNGYVGNACSTMDALAV